MEKVKIIIVDDHKLVRDGISAMFDNDEEISVIAKVGNADGLMNSIKQSQPEIILMDINLETDVNGIDCTRLVLNEYKQIKIIGLTMMKEPHHIKLFMEAGGKGYLLKNCGKEEIKNAIYAVMHNETYFSSDVMHIVMNSITSFSDSPNIHLTVREIEVLKLIVKEKTNPEIADILFISIRTVDAHRRNLLEKTGAKNTAGLVKYALKNNYVKAEEL